MGSDDSGLATDHYTWALVLCLGVAWVAAVRLCPSWRRNGPWAVPMSLFGFVWLGFGVDFVLRFLILVYDSVTFGNMTYRLAARPPRVVNETLLLALCFWVSVWIGFLCGVRRSGSGPYRVLTPLAPRAATSFGLVLTLAASSCILLAYGPFDLAAALFTPLAIVGRLWVVPATLVWWEYFRTGKRPTLRWVVLAPGLLHAWLSPYREHLAVLALTPFIAALFAGRRYRVSTLVLGASLFLVTSTVIIEVGRALVWSGQSMEEAMSDTGWDHWRNNPDTAPWITVLRRFHGLDSLLLTVDLVPTVFEHSRREVFLSAVTRGLVPRLLYPEKEESTRGIEFSLSIWVEDSAGSAAAIAPSMPGDLYEAGGAFYVVFGGLLWGLVVGICDGWKQHVPLSVEAVVTALFASQCAFSSERDFAHTVSTLIQTHVALTLGILVMLGRTQLHRPWLRRATALPAVQSVVSRRD